MASHVTAAALNRIRILRAACLCYAAMVLTGCDRVSTTSPQQAWEQTMQVRLARDYTKLWDSLARESKDEIAHVLDYVKHQPSYQARLRAKFQLDLTKLATMDAAGFFVALMTAVERNQPQIADLQMKNAEGAKFVRTRIKEDRAVVSWRSGTGKEEQTFFVREDGEWRPVLQRN